MLKRLGLGFLKGLVIGGAIGAGLHYGLPEAVGASVNFAGLFGFLISMGVAGTTGIFAGRAPWQEGAHIEAALKGVVGVALGALAYWGLGYIPLEIPFPGLEGTHALNALPVVFAPAISAVYGSMVELDNTGEAAKESTSKGKKARVAVDDDEVAEEEATSRRRAKKRRKA